MTHRSAQCRCLAGGKLVFAAAVLLAALVIGEAAHACTVSPNVASNLGTYSPGAVKAGVVPALRSDGGIVCGSAILSLLGSNRMKATFHSGNGLKLRQQGGSGSIAYTASADANGTAPFGQDLVLDYMQNNLLNLLGLLGGGSSAFPLYVKPVSGVLAPTGAYSDIITLSWDWKQCTGGIELLGICIGFLDVGTASSQIEVTLIVSPQGAILTMSSVTTWDPVNRAINPRSIPGSRNRSTIAVTNPDIVPIDPGTVALVLSTPIGTRLSLDGDGLSTGPAIRLAEGAPPSGLALRYASPGDTSDDVDFSSDGGVTWDYVPIVEDTGSEDMVTHVRLRPRGAMASQSSFSVSLPYAVR